MTSSNTFKQLAANKQKDTVNNLTKLEQNDY